MSTFVNQPVTTLDLLRHGACEGGEILRGTTDVELSSEGWQQMENATRNNPGWHQVVSSPLQRCRQFAEQLAGELAVPVTVDENWRELDFGEWEGQLLKELWQQQPEQLRRFFSDPETHPVPGGETVAQLQSRLQLALDALLNTHKGSHVLVVQHAGTIKFFLGLLFGFPSTKVSHFDVPYASLTRVRIYHDNEQLTPVLISHNPEGIR
ncbi:MAG: histidine phosphatase family protein [Pseudomonadales bacterium]|nr:histidine phosphatase family protein [Pseudomonadales bacterium]